MKGFGILVLILSFFYIRSSFHVSFLVKTYNLVYLGIEVLNQLEFVIVRFTKEFLNHSIWTWSILLIKFNTKEKFIEWLNSNLKDNSPLLTKGQYDEIIKYLKADD